jgi:hypothetical protein
MSCNNNKTTIIQGEKIILELDIIDKKTERPYPLTDVDEIQFCIFDSNGNVLQKTLTGGDIAINGDPLLGSIKVTLNIADTKLLKAEENQSFDVEVNKTTGEHRISKFERVLTVESRICA